MKKKQSRAMKKAKFTNTRLRVLKKDPLTFAKGRPRTKPMKKVAEAKAKLSHMKTGKTGETDHQQHGQAKASDGWAVHGRGDKWELVCNPAEIASSDGFADKQAKLCELLEV